MNVEASVETVGRCLDELGICFCFAPQLHPAMRQVAEVRRELGTPSIFNLLGPLSNRAGAEYEVLGVGEPAMRPVLAGALLQLPVKKAVVVCGRDGLDEVTLRDATDVSCVEEGTISESTWSPEDFGLATASLDSMRVETPEESAAMIRSLLDGAEGPALDIVVANAGAALWTAGVTGELTEAARQAREAVESGAANRLLKELAEASHA